MERETATGEGLTLAEQLECFESIKSPAARRLLTNLAIGAYTGRLSDDDMEIIAGVAEAMASRNTGPLSAQESTLVEGFRALTDRQQQGVVLLVDTFAPAPAGSV